MYSRAGRTVSHKMHVCVPIVKGGGRGRADVIEYVISASFDGGKLYPCRGANPEFTVRIISRGRLHSTHTIRRPFALFHRNIVSHHFPRINKKGFLFNTENSTVLPIDK